MAKIALAIKSINALFVNINLLLMLQKRRILANILLALFVASLHFFIMTTMIIQITVALTRNAIIHFSKLSRLLSCHHLCLTF